MSRALERPLLPVAGALCACLLLAGCGHGHDSSRPAPTGLIEGVLVLVGGPVGNAAKPVPGTITFALAGTSPQTLTVGKSGSFTVAVPAGSYNLTGHSPDFDSGKTTCRSTTPFEVTVGGTVTGTVDCQLK